MKNRLTFANVVGILLENKKKTYPQHKLITDLFSLCLQGERNPEDADLIANDNIMYSRWCTGTRPIPLEIIRTYEDDNGWNAMENDFKDYIIPNLINEPQTRFLLEKLLIESIDTLGQIKTAELTAIEVPARFFTAVMRYAILNDHSHSTLYSPDLSDTLLGGRIPSSTREFIGRKQELSEAMTMLRNAPLLFVTGIAGIGKSEFAKTFAEKNRKKYTNIIFLHYAGDLKKCIAELEFDCDNDDMTEPELFNAHFAILKKLHSDSLLIIDNFNVLPKDDAFFKELIKNDFQILITTRCKITSFDTLDLKELDREKELQELFYRHCPSAKKEPDVVVQMIDLLNAHTLTVCLAALSLSASGMEAEELLAELKSCGLNAHISEEIELYKDEEFTEALMMEHLRKLLQINKLSEAQTDILRNLSLLPASGVGKSTIKKWLRLGSLNDVNSLVRYGFVREDTENKKVSLHPLIQEVTCIETLPTVSSCQTFLDSLHDVCIRHGQDARRPAVVIGCMESVIERIANDTPEDYLLFLQDAFPFFEKYGITDFMTKLVDRIDYVMQSTPIDTPQAKSLLLDYKAELFFIRKDYANALKRRNKAISIAESLVTTSADIQSISLLSNIYNNTANIYLVTNKPREAAEYLKKAMLLRKDYAYLGLMDNHDMLQQLNNLTSLLVQLKDYQTALLLHNYYENLVAKNEGMDCLDYGICQFQKGCLLLNIGDFKNGEISLLSAEHILTDKLDKDNDYVRSTYSYLNRLYAGTGNRDKALAYKAKLAENSSNIISI